MAVILNKKEENDELSRRIAADLKAKQEESALGSNADPDFAEDSEYVKDFQKTGRFSWVFVLGFLVLAVVAVVLIFGL